MLYRLPKRKLVLLRRYLRLSRGNKALTFCAGVLLLLSFGFEMVEAIRLLCAADITLTLDTFYNLMKKVLNTLLAVQALLFVFALNPSVRVKD